MTRNVRFYFRSGVERALPTGDRPRSRFGRGAACQITPPKQTAVDYKATAVQAEQIVSAWRVLDVELDPDRVAKHLTALQHWSKN